MPSRVLVADDEPLIRQTIGTTLSNAGMDVSLASTGAEALTRVEEVRPDVMFLDLRFGDADGMDILKRVRADSPETKVVLITAHGSIHTAVTAMKLGCYDFVRKPFELDEILAVAKNAVRTGALERRVEYLDALDKTRRHAGEAICHSPAMKRVLQEVALVASKPVPVALITGESGTGKQLIARMLHDQSARASGPFVELNSSALPENLVESELFGHERGAFSDAKERKLGLAEVADGGTLFLDEVGDLGSGAQAKLLTFLDQRAFRRVGSTAIRRVEVRIVAATNRDIPAMVAEKQFREDLWYRLSALRIQLPPLRDRTEDVVPLVHYFLDEYNREFGRRWNTVSPEAADLLKKHSWPGNVRELRGVVSRAVLLHDEHVLEVKHLPADLVASALASSPTDLGKTDASAELRIPTLAEVELAHLKRVLAHCGGNQTAAAQLLGITRQTLAKKLNT